jgi:hypothetical protein
MAQLSEKLNILILAVPSTYLLVFFLVHTDGPFDLFNRIRSLAGMVDVIDSSGFVVQDCDEETPFLGRVLCCHRCTTPYAALIILVLMMVLGVVGIPLLHLPVYWLAVCGFTLYGLEHTDV